MPSEPVSPGPASRLLSLQFMPALIVEDKTVTLQVSTDIIQNVTRERKC